MMRIGYFSAADGGYNGRLHLLTADIDVSLVPADSGDSENAPDYRVMAGPPDEAREIGAGWNHVGEKAGQYVSIQIDDPMLARPLRASLFQTENGNHVLVWTRPPKPEASS